MYVNAKMIPVETILGMEGKIKQSRVNSGIIKGNRRDVKNRLRSACILISKMIFMNVMGKK
jgi:hypothetical protein